MQRFLTYTLLSYVSVATFVVRGTAQESDSGDDAQPLIVASDLDNRPFAFVDESGQPAGRDVRMMELLAGEIGRELEWRRMPFEKLLPAAEAGDVDVVCATIGVTKERAKRVRFTQPYFKTSIALLVRADDGASLWERRCKDSKIAAGAGTTSEIAVGKQLPGARHSFENKSGLSSSKRLTSRDVDGVAMDRPAAESAAANSEGALIVLPHTLADEDYALALPLASEALAKELDVALFKLESQLSELNSEYNLTPRPED